MPPEINFYNPRSLILFVCILQGVVFACLLFIRGFRKRSIADHWLAVLLIVMCTSLITHFIGFANVYDNNQWLTYFPFEIVFGLAPAIYLYVKHLTNESRKIKKADLMLFIPSLIYMVYFIGLFMQSLETKESYGNGLGPVIQTLVSIALFVWNSALLYLSIRHYRHYRYWLNDNYSDTELIKFNWLRNFLYLFALLFLIQSAIDLIAVFYKFSYIQIFYVKLLVAFITYYLAIAGYLRSQTIAVDFSLDTPESEPKIDVTGQKKEEDLDRPKAELLDLMTADRLYLDSQLTLMTLSKKLGVNTTSLSRIINKGFGKNFNDFVNEFRINDVKEKLKSGLSEDETLLGIALKTGFNSKATFNRAFKKFGGMSPKEYVNAQGSDGV